MKFIIALVLFVISTIVNSATEVNSAYLVIDASVDGGESKPTWIALAGKDEILYHPTGGKVAVLEPGLWTIAHVDFADKPTRRWGRRYLSGILSLNLQGGKIYYLGTLQLQSRVGHVNDFKIVTDASLLFTACLEQPEIFERFPLIVLHSFGKPERYVACKG